MYDDADADDDDDESAAVVSVERHLTLGTVLLSLHNLTFDREKI